MRGIRTAIVTGPTGAVGRALARRLVNEGVKVIAVVRPESTRALGLLDCEGVYLVKCNLGQMGQLPPMLSSELKDRFGGTHVDAFFHLAWAGTVGADRNDMAMQVGNIKATIDACRVAASLGCRVFVGTGSQAEYGRVEGALVPDMPCNPENGYGMAKLCAGQMSRVECRALGIEHVWARILSVYGPHDGKSSMISQVTRTLLEGGKPALTRGEQQWDYLYADDAAEALYLMAQCGRDGAVYTVGSGVARPLRKYIEELRDAINPALPLGFGEVPYGEHQVMHLQADISSLRADTGFEPAISFGWGIRNTIDWIANQHKLEPKRTGEGSATLGLEREGGV